MQFDFNKYVGLEYEQADCWELVTLVCHGMKRELPCLSEAGLTDAIQSWKQVESPKAGDVLLFERDGVVFHCGIAVSNRKFLHADQLAGAVIIDLFDGYWEAALGGIYRYE